MNLIQDLVQAKPTAIVLSVLKRVVLKEGQSEASVLTLRSTLQHFHLEKDHVSVLRDEVGLKFAIQATEPARQHDTDALLEMTLDLDAPVELPQKIRSILTQLFANPPKPRHPALFARARGQLVFNQLLPSLHRLLGGNNGSAVRIAADLANQFTADSTKIKLPPRLLLQAANAEDANGVADALADAMVDLGWTKLVVDCADYADEGEARNLVGGSAFWVGTTQGTLILKLRKTPRVVCVLKNIDRGHESYPAAVTKGLVTGQLHDLHGGEKGSDQPVSMPLNCGESIFLFTTDAASASMTSGARETRLGHSHKQQQSTLFCELKRLKKVYRQHQIPCINGPLLDQLRAHHHPILPETNWDARVQVAQRVMPDVLNELERMTCRRVRWAGNDTVDLAAIALLESPDLSQIQPQKIAEIILHDWQSARFLPSASRQRKTDDAPLVVGIIPSAQEQWLLLQDELGNDPAAALRSRREKLDLCFENVEAGWFLTGFQRQKIAHAEDFKTHGLISTFPKETLDSVVGHESIKAAFREMISQLREPAFFERHGLLPSRGVVLHGPPGTGKTLLAKALAAELKGSFIATTGSQLLQPGAVAEVFEIARNNQPSVILIDEADLGQRGERSPAHDAAINGLLAGIDGFRTHTEIKVVLATNYPKMIDPALLRSGRIDQSFEVGPLNSSGRQDFIDAKVRPLVSEQCTAQLVRITAGWSGAELAQLHRELVLAARRQTLASPGAVAKASLDDVLQQIRRLRGQETLAEETRTRVAVHEVGHALVHSMLFKRHSIVEISIVQVPTASGTALGSMEAQKTKAPLCHELRSQLAVLLAGRAAEELVYGVGMGSAGAENDLMRATDLAHRAVTRMGADEVFGPISLAAFPTPPSSLQELAAKRVGAWLMDAEKEARMLLACNRAALDALTAALLERWVLSGLEVADILTQTQAECIPQRTPS